LQAAFDYEDIFLPWVMADDPDWRSDPRWQAFRRQLNLPDLK